MPCRRLDGWIREYAGCKPVDGNYPAGGGSAFAGGLRTAERTVEKVRYLQPRLAQCQFDALVSFVFNVGSGNFEKSTLRKKVLANPADRSIRDEFLKWIHANGKPLEGLRKRRKDESELYFS